MTSGLLGGRRCLWGSNIDQWTKKIGSHSYFGPYPRLHTSAKLIEIRQNGHPKRHGLHELGCQMESDDTLHGSGGVPLWVLEPENSKFGPMGPKFCIQKILCRKLIGFHVLIFGGISSKSSFTGINGYFLT